MPSRSASAPGLDRDFRVLLGGQSVSAFGDAISFTAMPLLVLALTGSGLAMGAVGVLSTLPDLLLGLPAGAFADRWDRRRMMFWADLGRAALTALIPLSFVLGVDTMLVVLLVAFPINAFRVLFMAGFSAALPTLVGRERIGQANGYVEAVFSSSFILGPALAGLLVGLIGPALTLGLDAVSFFASALALTLIRRPMQGARERRETHIGQEIAEGIRFIVGHRTLRAIIGFWGLSSIVTAPLVPAVIYFMTVDGGADASTVGIVLSVYGLGYLTGALLMSGLSPSRLGVSMLLATVTVAPVLVVFAATEVLVVWVLASIAAGTANALALTSYITLRATIPPDALLGRVSSSARTISVGLQPIGVFTGGILLDAIGGRLTLVAIAAGIALVSGVFALSHVVRTAAVTHTRMSPA